MVYLHIEVIEVLNITQWKFSKIKDSLLVARSEIVDVAGKPKTIEKHDRKFIYEFELKYKRVTDISYSLLIYNMLKI